MADLADETTLHLRVPEEDDDVWSPRLREHRELTPEQWERFGRYAAEMFAAFGMDLDTPGTVDTPRRFVRALYDATDGYEGDPKLLTAFPTESKGGAPWHVDQIVEGPIPFVGLCEHHALPFVGHAFVGYVAQEEIIGLSKLTRLVRLWARRFTMQERMGDQIADTLNSLVHAQGVAVFLEAHHLCTQMRGVRNLQTKTRTAVWRGEYAKSAEMRGEFFRLAGASAA